jgi:hypothetical protein
MDFSSMGFFGLGPRTPRHDSVPQRHSWIFFCENGLRMSDWSNEYAVKNDLLEIVIVG